jgi:alkylation response protein AidB-like acyl-CoA dehydrogenase
MDFSWTKEQLDFKSAAIKFAKNELNIDLIERDKQSRFLRESWQKCADFGVLGLAVPEEYGGYAADI